jgi:hypothetical protein
MAREVELVGPALIRPGREDVLGVDLEGGKKEGRLGLLGVEGSMGIGAEICGWDEGESKVLPRRGFGGGSEEREDGGRPAASLNDCWEFEEFRIKYNSGLNKSFDQFFEARQGERRMSQRRTEFLRKACLTAESIVFILMRTDDAISSSS